MDNVTNIAQPVAPEDIRAGDYLAVLHVLCECMFMFTERSAWEPRPPPTFTLPGSRSAPVLVLDVCLPFVMVKSARGKRRLLDVRKYRVARVPESFGRRYFEEIEAQQQAENKSDTADDDKKPAPAAS